MDVSSLALPHVSMLPAYRPGRSIEAVAREYGLQPGQIVKLASNENPLGMSPLAEAALNAHRDQSRYPDFDCIELRDKLAAHHGLTRDHVAAGAGSSQLIALLAGAFVGAGDAVLYSQYAFALYDNAARWYGGRGVCVSANGLKHDLDRMLAAIEPDVKLVFLATPNNPTGLSIPDAEIAAFVEKAPQSVIVVLDEAYRDFLPEGQGPDVTSLVRRHRNFITLRTFSKAYGMAGLRVGYGLGDPGVIEALRRLQPPFSVGDAAQAAAIAALDDKDFLDRGLALNASERERLYAALGARGIEYVPSDANFILVRLGEGMQAFNRLMAIGVIIRPLDNYGLPDHVRVSIGTAAENDRFLGALDQVRRAPVAA